MNSDGQSSDRRPRLRAGCATIVLFLMAVVFPTAATAQSARFAEDLAQAQTLMSHGQYDDAIVVLQKLRQVNADHPEVLELLQKGYQRTQRYSELLELLVGRLPNSADRSADLATIADCQFKLNRIEAAESTLTRLLSPPPEDPQVYRRVAQTFRNNGRHLPAEETYLRARKQFGKPTLFSRELADLYEARREYTKAIQEYLVDLQENPRGLAAVRQKIAAIARMEDGTAELSAALRQIVAQNPNSFFAHRLYGELLLESGNAEAAWPEYLTADRLAEDPTEHVVYFIRRCLENKYYEAARQACLAFFERYPGHSAAVDVRLAYARALVGLQKPDSAIAVLHSVAGLFAQAERRAEVFYEIGNVYFDEQRLVDSAETYYRRTVVSGRRRDDLFKASARLGDCRLWRGDLAGADSVYAACADLRPNQEQLERVAFKRAELLFFSAQFDSAVTALKALVTEYPRGFFVNDAVALTMRINENREPLDWSLRRFAAASLKMRSGILDSARTLLGELAADSANGLADDALLELGRLHTQIGRPDSAVAAYGKLIERYPNGFLVPAALTAQGEVLASWLRQPEAARAAYRRVLTEFGDSPYLEEARRRLKELN